MSEEYDIKQHGYVIDDIRQWLEAIQHEIAHFSDCVEWQHAGLLLEYVHSVQQSLITIQSRLFYLNRIQALLDLHHKGLLSYYHKTNSYHVDHNDVQEIEEPTTSTGDVSIAPSVIDTETLESLDHYFERTKMK